MNPLSTPGAGRARSEAWDLYRAACEASASAQLCEQRKALRECFARLARMDVEEPISVNPNPTMNTDTQIDKITTHAREQGPATALPWIAHDGELLSGKTPLFEIGNYSDGRGMDERDAAYIAMACNAHPPLVHALRNLMEAYEHPTRNDDKASFIEAARAALALAKAP